VSEFSYTIRDEAGMHARPAGILVKAMQQFKSDVTLTKGDRSVSLKKLFALMGLAVKHGETVLIKAEGEDAEAAVAAAKEVLEREGL
jgi:phosphocarrier protein